MLSGCLLVWFLRRPQQVWHPYIWAEESFVVRHFLDGGWLGAVRPVQGYLILPTTPAAAPGRHDLVRAPPVLMFWSRRECFALTVVILVVPDSRWGGRGTTSLMAFAMVLCPVNPETFGVLLYTFWWAALWPVIILGWKRDLWWARIPLLVVAALSSPAGAAMAVPFAVSWWWSRRRVELVGVAILAVGAVVQLTIRPQQRPPRHGLDARWARCSSSPLITLGLFPSPWAGPDGVGVGRHAIAGIAVACGVDRGRRRVLAVAPSDRAAAASSSRS